MFTADLVVSFSANETAKNKIIHPDKIIDPTNCKKMLTLGKL